MSALHPGACADSKWEGNYSDPKLANVNAGVRFWNVFEPKVGRTSGLIRGNDRARGKNTRKTEDGGIQWKLWPRRSAVD